MIESKNRQCQRPEYSSLKAILQIIPHGEDILMMYFGNHDIFREINIMEYFDDYHYQNQTDRPEEISNEEWDKRKKDWDEAIGPDYIPADHGFTKELITNYIIQSCIFNRREKLTMCNIELPSKQQRAKSVLEYEKCPFEPELKTYTDALEFMQTDRYKSWKGDTLSNILEKINDISLSDLCQ